ncbi:glycine cleavage system P-protein-domain-containing protein [Pelagophyceae sp. CCMP2097]|nr:glycine cleavage system P-protein-domain-containing protein [Pelagophyceae sp. CCMP2097]
MMRRHGLAVTRRLQSSAPYSATTVKALDALDVFEPRHIGPTEAEQKVMLELLGFKSLDELVDATVPEAIKLRAPLTLEGGHVKGMAESEALATLKAMSLKNVVLKSLIGQGYAETATPKVIVRNMLENPGWYTAYTPYQAEISQGRLEMLLNYQTLVTDLTGLPVANASLLDEGTAAAEAMSMCVGLSKNGKKKDTLTFFIDAGCHPQTIEVVRTRCKAIGIEAVVADAETHNFTDHTVGVLWQYPDTRGRVLSADQGAAISAKAHAAGALSVCAADPLALLLLPPPAEMQADIAVGSMQRFGVPMGFGGPHAAYMATSEKNARRMPGRIIGETVEANERKGKCLRMAMQTREQHIRRDKATSNICTAQALLANMAASYAVYHGPKGLQDIANRCRALARAASSVLVSAGYDATTPEFDTFTVRGVDAVAISDKAVTAGFNVRLFSLTEVGLSFGETITREDVKTVLGSVFGVKNGLGNLDDLAGAPVVPSRKILQHEARLHFCAPRNVFNAHQSETKMLRYLKTLENKDLALNHSMIALGSCTMKLNATSEMIPVGWPEFSDMHPFAPQDQTQGYVDMIDSLCADLCLITGFDAVSVQPNSGASGEYAGLLAIRAFQKANGQEHRDVCLIPVSAHGTNPASAVMAGMKVVVVASDEQGNVDFDDFLAKADKHKDNLSCLMITYPSTYGVFEERVADICAAVHERGGDVYMDGANLNAQVGLTSPGRIGADVCHLNMHKTFCIPHGGGGPGVGAIGVAKHLAPYLPGHTVVAPVAKTLQNLEFTLDHTPVSAAPFGSAMILPISWMYIKMLGSAGLTRASAVAILNANYLAKRMEGAYDVLFRGKKGQCAHEYIIDLRGYKACGVSEEDVAKRLQDYGFHSPTMSWPVSGTLMIEPTESEGKAELDRFADALIAIRAEIQQVQDGQISYEDSPLHHAPHTLLDVTGTDWDRKYSRETAAFPAPWVRSSKFWPTCGRVDNVHGDRNLICTCAPVSDYE